MLKASNVLKRVVKDSIRLSILGMTELPQRIMSGLPVQFLGNRKYEKYVPIFDTYPNATHVF